ncbi:transcriptional regulator [Hanamia caeni]|jgi:DNA-binding MarR family transcriptional regulator|uniref:Transcriptional regulator n=1 Tax=Hanamia caeni TaxID=2294116 RepID=A0A3M9N983_9BACT|nr:transcriptional regulator [Hanamia caeni]RNI33518.1 transcriptional regulator [Hanamia caeni]
MNLFQSLNKEFESRIRLGIMSILMVNEWVEFKEMKETLDITDGNLASHITGLEKNDYIEVKKEFVGKKPKTSYRATKTGRKAFNLHLNALEKLINRK